MGNTKIDVAAYTSELLFHAAVSEPWQVSEGTFVAVIAMLSNGTRLSAGERDDIVAFFALACDFAADGGMARWDSSTVYRKACETAKSRGFMTYATRQSSAPASSFV